MTFDPRELFDVGIASETFWDDYSENHEHGDISGVDRLAPHLADAYRYGFRDALRRYGIYKNGTQVIGCQQHPINEVIAKVADAAIPIDEFSKDI